MKFLNLVAILLCLVCILTACKSPKTPIDVNAVKIVLNDNDITVDGESASTQDTDAVYTANDIIYYEEGKDFTYGEGGYGDAHSAEEAAAHTVVHITKAGTYSLTGKLSQGQIAIDLGEDAKKDETAVVTLILNNLDITCTVAPAVIFYNVYECGNTDADKATKDVDTTKAGANVIIADGTTNTVNGAYVEKIYKPDTLVFNQDKTKVEDAKKLHKYDGAFYSKMSMNIDGEGTLNIRAANEGLDSELHLTINGGTININSANDGINTNEDNVSVTTVNGGIVNIVCNGQTGEGDGIDSNGWLVINGGIVLASACSTSADSGIDSDKGIHINGGTVIASGNMLDRIEDGGQTYAVFSFANRQDGKTPIILKDRRNNDVTKIAQSNAYQVLVYSSAKLKKGNYTLWANDKQLAGQSGSVTGGMQQGGMQRPADFPQGERPQFNPDEMPQMPNGATPPDFQKGEMPELPEGDFPEKPQGERPNFQNGDFGQFFEQSTSELSTEFKIVKGGNIFSRITLAE